MVFAGRTVVRRVEYFSKNVAAAVARESGGDGGVILTLVCEELEGGEGRGEKRF